MTTLMIIVGEVDGMFKTSVQSDDRQRRDKRIFDNYQELVSGIAEEIKSARNYASVLVIAESIAQTPQLVVRRKGEGDYETSVSGPFGQCDAMYKLKENLQRRLKQ